MIIILLGGQIREIQFHTVIKPTNNFLDGMFTCVHKSCI